VLLAFGGCPTTLNQGSVFRIAHGPFGQSAVATPLSRPLVICFLVTFAAPWRVGMWATLYALFLNRYCRRPGPDLLFADRHSCIREASCARRATRGSPFATVALMARLVFAGSSY